MRQIVGTLLVVLALSACVQAPQAPADPPSAEPETLVPATTPSPLPTPTPRPSPSPSPTPWWKQGYQSNWTPLSVGTQPADYMTAQQEGYMYSWFYDAHWQIRNSDGDKVLAATATSGAYEPLSFLHYRGDGLGPDGALPARYRVDVEARSLGGANRYHGYGELAIQAFYVDPKHYVEVVQNDEQLSLWEANDAQPNSSKGWKQLAVYDHPATTSAWVKFGAGIDLSAGRAWLVVDGQPVASGQSELLTGATGSFAIRATGNLEEWRSISAQPIH